MTRRALRATYRLQFGPRFTFEDAIERMAYLADLGVSHVYASPIFAARPGSAHGYDVVDHGRISPELGGEAGFRNLVRHLDANGLGLVLDIVPNHAGIAGAENARWLDVLEFGPRSRWRRFFDIDWTRGRLTLPLLDDDLSAMIAAGAFAPVVDGEAGRIALAYWEHRLPLRPRSVADLLRRADPSVSTVAEAWAALEDRRPDVETVAAGRAALATALSVPGTAEAVVRDLGDAATVAALLADQHYRLIHWRAGATALTYRRFFDIADLAGVRVEDPGVFDEIHRLPLALLQDGAVEGLRVDHVDGMADPERYCRRLREAAGPDAVLLVEKILEPGEMLRDWPVDGTTGYESLNLINGLFVQDAGWRALADFSAELGATGTAAERLRLAKQEILQTILSGELRRLAALAAGLLPRRGFDGLGRRAIRRALVEWIAALPVYRTYIGERLEPEDARLVEHAARLAESALGPLGRRALGGLVRLMRDAPGDAAALGFVRRLQQLSGPAMAKGYEDTELYRYPALLSVNEVGGSLARPAVAPDAFHAAMVLRAARTPSALVPLSTHDTKRGADTRARLNLLSEIAPDWILLCRRWMERHAGLKARLPDGPAPDAVDELYLYETVFGVWPAAPARISDHMTKAMREAKRHTHWTRIDEAYETAVRAFVALLLTDAAGAAFRADMEDFAARCRTAGRRNGLAQTVLQLTVPGVPDIYQGSELWEHLLVDPDNRNPVDWSLRRRLLAEAGSPALDADSDGAVKQRLIATLLDLRRASPDLFARGAYLRLPAVGGPDVVAFARAVEDEALVVAVPTRAFADPRAPILVALPFPRWSLRAVVSGHADAEDIDLRTSRGEMPLVAVLDILPD